MKTKNVLGGLAIAVVLQLGMLAGSAQTNIYLYSGSKTNITLPPGAYIITAYGAPGGYGDDYYGVGGPEAEMSAEFNFSTSTTLTLLVGERGGDAYDGGGGSYITGGGGGGGGSFVCEASRPLVIAGGGGGGGGGGNNYPGAGGSGGTGPFGGDGGANEGWPYLGGSGGYPGDGGRGGGGNTGGGGGGGFYYNGGDGTGGDGAYSGGGGGSSFENGGFGGYGNIGNHGGFGGGGGGGNVDAYDYIIGGGGGGGGYGGGGGGNGDSSVGSGGGGGGSIIDSSAIAILTELSGILNSVGPWPPTYNGEIIITAVPTPLLITTHAAFGFTNGVFGFNVIGPAGSNVVIQASADLQNWILLQSTLLGSGPFYFSDPQSPTNVQRFYRAAYAYTVGGSLTGLPAGDTVTLQDNGSDNLTLSNNGTFTFPTALPDGQSYSVTYRATTSRFGAYTFFTNGSGTISGANVTNVAVTFTPVYTGNPDVDMLNAAVWDGTDHGGVPGVMLTEYGGPLRVTAIGPSTHDVAQIYSGWARFATIVAPGSCSSTTFPVGTHVIQFGTAFVCQPDEIYGY